MLWQHYYQASSVSEALELLANGEGRARLVAGSTDLTIRLRREELQIETLVGITRIPGLDAIERTGDGIRIGAGVTHGDACASPLLQELAPILADACRLCGSPQIRNVGTLVGNVINAQPAADATTALVALDARLRVAGPAGERVVPVDQACLGPGRSAIDPSSEMVTHIEWDQPATRSGAAYERLSLRRSLTLPVIACGVAVQAEPATPRLTSARIAVGPVAPVPWRARRSEDLLMSGPVAAAVVEEAARLAAIDARPRSGLRGSAEYRREMVHVLVKRALIRALQRAGIDV